MTTRVKPERIFFPGFAGGLGAGAHVESGYAVATNCDTRWGHAIPGPREVADMTGIPAGFYVVDWIAHNGVNILAATNGVDTRVLREQAGAWVVKGTFVGAAAAPHCLLSFHDGSNSTLICFLGASTAFQYSTNDGTTWTASTRTGSTKFGNMGIVRQNARTAADVLYVVNPNQIYTATSMVNGGSAATTGATIGDNSAQNYFNSVVEDDTGVVLFGMRHAVWSMDSSGAIFLVSQVVQDPPADAGGTSDRRNFEAYAMRGGRIYYIVSGYEVWEYYHGVWNVDVAPWHQAEVNGVEIPRCHLPLNAITNCGGWLVLSMGLKDATKRNLAFSPGGTNLLQNTILSTSELYVGAPRETAEGYAMIWHGSILSCTDPLRFLWFDPSTNYLYLASGDAESADAQQNRCFFATSDPLTTAAASVTTLNSGTVTIESGVLSADYPFDSVVPHTIKLNARGLSATVSAAVRHRFVPDSDTTSGFTTLETWTNNERALAGTRFPRLRSFQTGRLQFVLVGSGNSYPVLRSAEVILLPFGAGKVPAMAY